MLARAAAAEATRRRILEVLEALLKTRFRSEIRLDDVAAAAQVTVQTIINIFGNRSTLLSEAYANLLQGLRAQRLLPEPGDIDGAVSALVEHYELFGDLVVRNLVEQADPELIETGKAGHRKWVQRQFAASLEIRQSKERRSLTDALVCVCDVYAWKLLRRDMGRTRAEAEQTILLMVKAMLVSK
jgi:AcrR family transcriptional regulator